MGELRWIGRLHSGARDAAEQVGSNGTIGERRDRLARLGQIGIGLRVERRTRAARRGPPLGKAFGWHRLYVEAHIGETIAAEMRRKTPRGSGMVCPPRTPPPHSPHPATLHP